MNNEPAPELDLVGTAEAARMLGNLDKSTITRFAQTGELPIATRLPGKAGALLFRRADVERLIAERDREQAARAAADDEAVSA